jgi:hypothetical protein
MSSLLSQLTCGRVNRGATQKKTPNMKAVCAELDVLVLIDSFSDQNSWMQLASALSLGVGSM